MGYVLARLRIIRPFNAAMAAAGVLVGLALTNKDLPAVTWVGAPLAAALITAFGNVLNDIVDLELDRTAHPERPLPSGAMTPTDARVLAAILLAVGLVEAWIAAGIETLTFAAGVAAGLGLYEARLKKTGLPGNILIAALVAATFPFGALAAGGIPGWGLLWALTSMAFLANLARELWKDLEDEAADRPTRKTLPARIGAWTHAVVAMLVAGAVALTVIVPPPRATWSVSLPLLVATDLAFLAAVGIGSQDVRKGQRLLKLSMVLALAAYLSMT